MKAMILAAGRGTRMGALTETLPKPLLKVGKYSLIEHNLIRLARAGIQEVVINVSYLGALIQKKLGDGAQFNLHIQYSDESERMLGPGGGIIKALPLLGDSHFMLMGADLWSDFPLETLLTRRQHLGHMVMVDNPAFHPSGDYGIDNNGFLTQQPPALTYAGFSVWHPDLFRDTPIDYYEITPFIQRAMAKQSLTAEKYAGAWHNIGTAKALNDLNAAENQPRALL